MIRQGGALGIRGVGGKEGEMRLNTCQQSSQKMESGCVLVFQVCLTIDHKVKA